MTSWTFSTSTPRNNPSRWNVQYCLLSMVLISGGEVGVKRRIGVANDRLYIQKVRDLFLDHYRPKNSIPVGMPFDRDGFLHDVIDASDHQSHAAAAFGIHHHLHHGGIVHFFRHD